MEDNVAFKIIEPHLAYINGTPDLLSGLYDANLLPEQIRTVTQANVLVKVVEAHKRGEIPSHKLDQGGRYDGDRSGDPTTPSQ